jgi:hypothetical protein
VNDAEAHRHRWSVIDFFVERDRPMLRQSCACGATRAIPAWDRSWSPDPAPEASTGNAERS